MGRVQGKVALVTGGASGIGRGCAELLAAEGASIVVSDIQNSLGQEVVDGIVGAGGNAVYINHDVTDEAAWARVVAHAVSTYGGLDILVNNAGIGLGGPITDMTLERWRFQQAINVDGVFLGLKHSIPAMRKRGGGSIINMSSIAGMKGSANMGAYCATKGAVRLLSKSIALECAQAKDGIRVNSVHPGVIDTPIWNGISQTLSDSLAEGAGPSVLMPPGANRPDLNALTAMITPLGFPGLPRDIAEGVLFLASDASRYITGTEMIIDGGNCA